MSSERPAQGPLSQSEDRRRSKRFPLVVPVSLKWKAADGLSAEAEGQAVEGNNHGGLLQISEAPGFGTEAALTNLLSRQTIRVQVLSLRTPKEGKPGGLAVSFITTDNDFWGALGMEGQVGAEFQSASQGSGPPARTSIWKSLLQTILGRP